MIFTEEQILLRLLNECDIYFEDSLISKEILLRKYFNFLTTQFRNDSHSIAISQDTGSFCFGVISILATAIQCLIKSQRDEAQVVCSLEPGDYILYNRRERCIWDGFVDQEYVSADYEHAVYAKLMQPDKGNLVNYVPRSSWNDIIPYNGSSTRTDGRGIRKSVSDRVGFISFLFGLPPGGFPSITNISAVIVTEQEFFKRIYYGTKIVYNEKSIKLCDIVTASYFTSTLVEQQYGSNPAKTEPILKVTSSVSVARSLVLDKNGNKTLGFLVMSIKGTVESDSELLDLLERKSLSFSLVSTTVDSNSVQNLIELQEEAAIFICTREFLMQNSGSISIENEQTVELQRQIDRIINMKVTPVLVDSEMTWSKIREVKSSLSAIRHLDIDSPEKDEFIITAYSLVNVILTAISPLGNMNRLLEQEGSEISVNVSSPKAKLEKLIELSNSTELKEYFSNVVKTIKNLYDNVVNVCPKRDVLLDLLKRFKGKTIGIIVPKEYYTNFIYNGINDKITVMTANSFRASEHYDVIVSVGIIAGKKFNLFTCHAAPQVFVLLYDGEERLFLYKQFVKKRYDKYINDRLGVSVAEIEEVNSENAFEDVEDAIRENFDLENYIEKATSFDIYSFARGISGVSMSSPMAEVSAVGSFTTHEKIFFTKHYQVVSFEKGSRKMVEKNIDALEIGDKIVFVNRDDGTKNMVDFLYNQMMEAGKLNKEVNEATPKSRYWKQVLRRYKEFHNMTYGELAKALEIQEVTVRQWLIEDSHIVGPRDENTLKKIASLTQDPHMLTAYHEIFETCKIVRSQRLKILKLIDEAVKIMLYGSNLSKDDLLRFVFENVDSLSKILELSDIFILEDSVSIPTALTNKPISETELN